MRRRRLGRHYKLGRKSPRFTIEWGPVRSYRLGEEARATGREAPAGPTCWKCGTALVSADPCPSCGEP